MTDYFITQNKVTEEIALDSFANKTGDVWHVFLKGDFKDMLYGYKFDGKFSPQEGHYFDPTKIVLDPYAKVSFIWLIGCYNLFELVCCRIVTEFAFCIL